MVMGINFGGKSSEKKVNSQMERIMIVTNVNAGTVPAINTEHYSSPLTAIALAAGRLFRPKNKEIQAIDQQLNSIIMNPEVSGMAKLKPAMPVVENEPIILESVKVVKVQNYKEALPLVVETGPEMKEMIEDVKEFATKFKGNVNFTPDIIPAETAAANVVLESPGEPRVEIKAPLEPAAKKKDPLADMPAPKAKSGSFSLDDDFMAKLKESSKVEVVSNAKDIRRDMVSNQVTCDDLENGLEELSLIFRKAAKKSSRKR